MTRALTDYAALLEKHDRVIRQEYWYDGRRDELVKEMDKVWHRLSASEKKDVVHVYARRLYERRI